MVLKKGRFGTFFACSGYPDCKTTKQIGGTQKKPDQPLDEKCPQCGNNLVLKSGRFGEFTACSNYPTCKYVKQKTIGVKCPECSEGEIIERRSQEGQDVLRLQSLSRLQVRRLGQAGAGEVPGMRQPVHGGEVAEGRRRSGSAPTPSASTRSRYRWWWLAKAAAYVHRGQTGDRQRISGKRRRKFMSVPSLRLPVSAELNNLKL